MQDLHAASPKKTRRDRTSRRLVVGWLACMRRGRLLLTMAAANATTLTGGKQVKAIFSDLDGTIVHFPAWFEEHGSRIISRDPEAKRAVVESPSGEQQDCRLLPSSTMGDGCVSERTIELVAALRSEGVLFFVVTAARKSTLIERMPLLPVSDAYVGETGSRIYKEPGVLDTEWANGLVDVCGPLEREMPAEERPEVLWQFYRRLQQVPGLKVDGRSYYGCFRVDTKGDEQVEASLLAVLKAELPEQLAWAMNLGKFDFFPKASGKGNAVAYLQRQYGLAPEECVALFDDDNDLPMARQCGTQLLPGLTSESVRRAAKEHPEWTVASRAGQGVFAIDELLEGLLAAVRQPAAEPVLA